MRQPHRVFGVIRLVLTPRLRAMVEPLVQFADTAGGRRSGRRDRSQFTYGMALMARRCDNCGREGVLSHVADVVLDSRPTEVTYGEGHREEAADQRVLLVERCEVCRAPTMSTYRYIDGWSDPSDFLDLQQICPMRRLSDDLPQRVWKRYQKMLQIQAEPDAFAVRAGRLLEAICSDQGVAEGDLGPRLDQLAGKKRQTIPRALADQAHLVRKFRNVGGHDGAGRSDRS